jgi:hypothetical protein
MDKASLWDRNNRYIAAIFTIVILLTILIQYFPYAVFAIMTLMFVGGVTIFIINHPTIALIGLMALFPIHSLAMRFIQVEFNIPPSLLTIISLWKEYILMILLLQGIIRNHLRIRVNLLDGLIIFYLIFSMLYILKSEKLTVGLYGFRGIAEPFAFYLLAKLYPLRLNNLNKFIRILFLVSVLISIFGFFQTFILGDKFLVHYKTEIGILSSSHYARIAGSRVIRASSTFTTPNQMGMYLAILLLIALGKFTQDIRDISLTDFVIIFIILGGLLITLSRSSWMAFGIGLLLLLFSSYKIKKKFLYALIGLLVTSIPIAIKLNFYERIVETLSLEDPSAAGRIPSIMNGLAFVVRNPLGIGLGMAGPRAAKFHEILRYHAENYYILMAMEIGLFGLLIYLILITTLLASLFSAIVKSKHRFYRGIRLGTFLAVIGVHTGIMFIPSLQELSVASLLWFFVGVSLNHNCSEALHTSQHYEFIN